MSNKKRSTGVIFREKILIKMETNVRQLLENMTWFLRSFMIFSKKIGRDTKLQRVSHCRNFSRGKLFSWYSLCICQNFVIPLVYPSITRHSNSRDFFQYATHVFGFFAFSFSKKKTKLCDTPGVSLDYPPFDYQTLLLTYMLVFLSVLRIFFS